MPLWYPEHFGDEESVARSDTQRESLERAFELLGIDVPQGPAPVPRAIELMGHAAARIGVELRVLDPEYGHLIELVRGDQTWLLLGGLSPLNSAVAARLAEDKFFTSLLLARAGFRVPETVRCLGPFWDYNPEYRDKVGLRPALSLAARRDYPLVVKPNRLSRGRGVVRVDDRPQLEAAVEGVWKADSIALVQELVPGRDLRLDYLDGERLVAYERSAVRIEGDGKRTVRELLQDCDRRFEDPSVMRSAAEEPAWQRALGDRGWTEDSVLGAGEPVEFGDGILNLQRLATARLMDEEAATRMDAVGRAVGAVLGLRFWGVDLRLTAEEETCIIEVNSSPLLAHLHRLGHEDLVLDCQVKMLKAIVGD